LALLVYSLRLNAILFLHLTEVKETAIRVLGVWVDPKLQWKEHVKQATSKGNAAFDAFSKITAST
jgi:hypothetical protein